MVKGKKHAGIVILVASLLMAVNFMEMGMVFSQTKKQTKASGIYQLKNISGALENTISNAENLTMKLALEAREYLDDEEKMKAYIYAKKKEQLAENNGVFNVLIVNNRYTIIPDFDMPDTYIPQERMWYIGAIRNQGKTYVTPPYQDAMTGNICYSVAVMLGDGETVFSMDYTMENIQAHIAQMYKSGSHNAVIVTDEGIIAGCSDESLLGKKLTRELPDYMGIWSLARSKNGLATARIKAKTLYDNLFAMKSGNGWYLIVKENEWEMYRSSYLQLGITALLSVMLFAVVIILYLMAVKNQKRAEDAFLTKEEFLNGITGDLREPLGKILEKSDEKNEVGDYRVRMLGIHEASEQLAEMINQIISYSSIVRTEKKSETNQMKAKGMNRRFRTIIISFMCIVMIVSLYTNLSVTYQWGNDMMETKAVNYQIQLSEWINTQKSLLDMFVSIISTHPEMLDDYEGTVDYLNRITIQYPEISVTYMTNPDLPHTVYMNNGWEPEPGWHVEQRDWYVDLMESENDWIISSPYYDEQTGGYCVTFAKRVYDAETGEFLGNFGIDFFMDKLVQILGDSYTDTGYAFLVDTEGDIINHPYGRYQMSQDEKKNVSSLPYGKIQVGSKGAVIIEDYNGSLKVLSAARNEDSNFSVYVVSDIWMIYGKVAFYGTICLVTFLACIILVYRILSDLAKWQEMTNQKVKDAADSAIAAGKAKGQFLAQMSHEIRTPINAVLGMNEMILRESQDEEILEYAGNIQEAGKNLLTIINSILDFSKIEDGKMEIIPVKYELATMINNLVHTISERAKAKSLELFVDVDEKLPSVLFGDDVRISQVIMNLLTNAVKYTEEGWIKFSIHEKQREGNSILLQISVRDSGIGIRKEDMGKLFESFERLEEKRNRNIEGTGLGISIVTKLLNMMESELLVDSIYGEGSDFHFEIRQSIIDEEPVGDYEKRIRNHKEKQKRQEHLYAPHALVLVVDDNEMNLTVAKNLMKLYGFVPKLASSGQEAIDIVRKEKFHLIFMDHMMPKMDGIETLEKLKEEHLISEDTTVIALTANAVVGAREKYMAVGFDDYLTKPIESDLLEEKLADLLPPELVGWRLSGKKKGKTRQSATVKPDMPDEKKSMRSIGTQKDHDEILKSASYGKDGHPVFAFDEDSEAQKFSTDEDSEAQKFSTGEDNEARKAAPDGDDEVLEFAPDGDDGILEFDVQEDEKPEKDAQNSEQRAEHMLDNLKDSGLNLSQGLRYCGDNEAFYAEVLHDFAESFERKKIKLCDDFEHEDWQDYQIQVHSLKSSAKTIGAGELSRMAKELEDAAGQREEEKLKSGHEKMMEEYEKDVKRIKEAEE